jgi:hypothetical protein
VKAFATTCADLAQLIAIAGKVARLRLLRAIGDASVNKRRETPYEAVR